MTNLAANLVDTANGHADRVAVRVGETAMTYGELARASSRVAGMLRERGVKPGDPAAAAEWARCASTRTCGWAGTSR